CCSCMSFEQWIARSLRAVWFVVLLVFDVFGIPVAFWCCFLFVVLFRVYFCLYFEFFLFFFFFQAEDGIRDATVTGVQTCALPILHGPRRSPRRAPAWRSASRRTPRCSGSAPSAAARAGRRVVRATAHC